MGPIALVHDNFAKMGEAEKVAEALYRILPKTQLYTTLAAPIALSPSLERAEIKTTWMQRLPKPEHYYRHYFLFYPLAIESIDLSQYELVVSSCSGYAKGVRKHPDAIHVSYCHAPMPWVWRFEECAARENFGSLKRSVLQRLLLGLKWWDLRASERPDYFIASSLLVAKRIKEIYRRESVVIPPPIDVDRFKPCDEQGDYYLVLSQLTANQRIDLAIEACNSVRRKLIIIGDGRDRERLQLLAGPTVKFFGRQPGTVIDHYVSRCRAMIIPSKEDFGRNPLEVNATGRPVILFSRDGGIETVIQGRTGIFFNQPSARSLADAIVRFERCSWDQQFMRRHAEQYDYQAFNNRILSFLNSVSASKLSSNDQSVEEKTSVTTAFVNGSISIDQIISE